MLEIAQIAKISREVTTRFSVAAMHPRCKELLHVEVIAFKDGHNNRELDFDDFTYSESWIQLTTDEAIDMERQIMQSIAKEYPDYE